MPHVEQHAPGPPWRRHCRNIERLGQAARHSLAAMIGTWALLGLARDLNAADYIYLTPDIGEHLWLVEEYMPTSSYGDEFATGALIEVDFFGGFADLDGDGVDELLIAVDHPIACDEDMCDVFTFKVDGQRQSLAAPCNWLPAERTRTPIKRSMFERFVETAEHTVVLTNITQPYHHLSIGAFDGRFDGQRWKEYFAAIYDTPVERDEIRLSDIRVGTYDLNGDGRDEVFIYAVSPSMCGFDECGGAILELLPVEEGGRPGWRWIGDLLGLYVADNLIIGDDISSHPARRIKVLNKVIDGYPSLCTRQFHLSWNGETYDLSDHGCALP